MIAVLSAHVVSVTCRCYPPNCGLVIWLRSKNVDKTIVYNTKNITTTGLGEKQVIRPWALSALTPIMSCVPGLSTVAHLILGTSGFFSFFVWNYRRSPHYCQICNIIPRRLISQYELASMKTKYAVKYEQFSLSHDMDSEAS